MRIEKYANEMVFNLHKMLYFRDMSLMLNEKKINVRWKQEYYFLSNKSNFSRTHLFVSKKKKLF